MIPAYPEKGGGVFFFYSIIFFVCNCTKSRYKEMSTFMYVTLQFEVVPRLVYII